MVMGINGISLLSSTRQVIRSPICQGLVVVAIIGAATVVAIVGTLRISKDRVVLRDPSEALSFLQDWIDFLGAIIPK